MTILPIYLSAPAVVFGEHKTHNNEVLEKVKENFIGPKEELRKIISGIKYVFSYCGTENRFLGTSNGKTPVEYAIEACRNVLKKSGTESKDIDLLIYGGIYRDYFEPATAQEISSRLGIKKIHCFDVTNACAGLLQSVSVAFSLMQTDLTIKNALCCTTDFPDVAIDYNIQSFAELTTKAAGLTLGSAASAWVLSRDLHKNGSLRIITTQHTSLPDNYSLCQVPIGNRKFTSMSKEIFDLGIQNVPDEIVKLCQKLNWKVEEIDMFLSHQPGKKIAEKVCASLGIQKHKAPVVHQYYGNTVNSSVPMTMDYVLKNDLLRKGDKVIMNSAAAGFTMVSIAGEWA
jgi:3-oxoacyl-[acyl-carrier-protein] synthase III